MPTRLSDECPWHASTDGLMDRSMLKFRVLSRIAAGVVLVVAVVAGASPASAEVAGIDWTIRTSAADNNWESVTYGNGLFVAVSSSGTGNRVMTSPDGITWTSRSNPVDNPWYSVIYGNGLFVAVAASGTGNRVMTSGSVGVEQTITFANPGDQELPTGTVSLTATADSGLTVSLASSTTSVCTVSGTTLSLVAEGTCTITASQAGSGDYLAADDVERSFTVSKVSQTITFAEPASQSLTTGSSLFEIRFNNGIKIRQ